MTPTSSKALSRLPEPRGRSATYHPGKEPILLEKGLAAAASKAAYAPFRSWSRINLALTCRLA
jgi:hypothetical protein